MDINGIFQILLFIFILGHQIKKKENIENNIHNVPTPSGISKMQRQIKIQFRYDFSLNTIQHFN